VRGEFDPNLSCAGVVWPAATEDHAGHLFLYVSERRCDEPVWRHVSLFVSANGTMFRRAGTVSTTPDGNTDLYSGYVVDDGGKFRGWFQTSDGLRYGESNDGLQFRLRGPAGPGGQIDFIFKRRDRWYFLYTRPRRPDSWVPALMTFDPRKERFRDAGPIASNRPIQTQMTGTARRGDSELRTGSTQGFSEGDLIVVAPSRGLADVVRVSGVGAKSLKLATPLRRSHQSGETVAVSDRRKVSPSFVCRRANGNWSGIFTVFEAVPGTLYEQTLAYRAPSLHGPWRIDYRAPAPVFTLDNRGDVPERSVENPTPVMTSPRLPHCADLP
jgi:hypothetical protein